MNSNESWVLHVDPTAYKFLRKIPRVEVARILMAFEQLPSDPFRGDIQKMKGEDSVWRKRIGNYRIQYEIIFKEKIIHVFRVARRTSTTYSR